MRKATHLAMGLYLFLMLDRLFLVENQLILACLVAIGSILPDIDIVTSSFGRKVKLVGEVFKHRGFIHTIYPILLLVALVHAIWTNWIYTVGFGVAYFFHLLLDGFTKMGIRPFWIGPKLKGFAKTGKMVDKILFVFLIVVSVLMVFNVI